MSHQKFAKDVVIIGFTQIVTSLGVFFLIPVLTKMLGATYYGIWAQISITISLLSPLVLMGLSIAVIRFLAAEKNIEAIREGIFSVIFFVLFSGIAVSALVFVLSDFLAISVFGDLGASYFIKAGSGIILLTALDQISLYYFRFSQHVRIFAYLTIFDTIGRVFLITLFLLLGWGLLGVIGAVLIIQSLVFIISLGLIISEIGFRFPKFTFIKKYLQYGAPLVPNSLIRWISDSSDRYIVGILLGINAVGIYSAAYVIGSLIFIFIAPIQFILLPELSRLFDEKKIEQVKFYLSYSMKYFLLLAIPAAFGLSALSKEILQILTTPEFVSGSIVIPFIAISGIFAGIFQIIINILHLVKKVQINFYIQILAAISNLLLNFILIPIIGFVGAAVATMISYIVMVALCLKISSKYILFNLDGLFAAKSVFASIIMAGLIMLIHPRNYFGLLITIITGAVIYMILILLMKGITIKELIEIRNLLYD